MIDGDLRLLPLHPPIHPPSSKVKKKKTKISVGGEGSISGERKQTTGGRKRREHGTCSSSVPRDAFFYASHFLRFQKRKKKKKNSTQNERLLRRTNQGFFHQEGGGGEGGGGGELRRSSKKILNRAARWGCRGRPRNSAISLVSRGRGKEGGRKCDFHAREQGIIANDTHKQIYTRTGELHACVRSRKASFLTDNAFVFIVDLRHL